MQQDVESQKAWPGCVIWGKSVAFPEPLFAHLHNGDDNSTLPSATVEEVDKNPSVKMPSDA